MTDEQIARVRHQVERMTDEMMRRMMEHIRYALDRVNMNIESLVRKQEEPGFWATLFDGIVNMQPVIERAQVIQNDKSISFGEALQIASAEEAAKPSIKTPTKA
jgi:hypothetical protein